jgi:hypothetical protein
MLLCAQVRGVHDSVGVSHSRAREASSVCSSSSSIPLPQRNLPISPGRCESFSRRRRPIFVHQNLFTADRRFFPSCLSKSSQFTPRAIMKRSCHRRIKSYCNKVQRRIVPCPASSPMRPSPWMLPTPLPADAATLTDETSTSFGSSMACSRDEILLSTAAAPALAPAMTSRVDR